MRRIPSLFLECFWVNFISIRFQFLFLFSQLRETISSVTLASKHVPAHWLKLTERNVFYNFGVEQQQQTSNWKWNWNLNIKLKMKLKLKHQIETETHCYWNLKHQTKTLVNVQNNKPKNTFLRFIRDKQGGKHQTETKTGTSNWNRTWNSLLIKLKTYGSTKKFDVIRKKNIGSSFWVFLWDSIPKFLIKLRIYSPVWILKTGCITSKATGA